MAARPSSIIHAVDKARKVQPLIEARVNRPGDWWVAGTSTAYLVEVRDGRVTCTGDWKGPCKGFSNCGVCYHSAAVALHLGLYTEQHDDALRRVAA